MIGTIYKRGNLWWVGIPAQISCKLLNVDKQYRFSSKLPATSANYRLLQEELKELNIDYLRDELKSIKEYFPHSFCHKTEIKNSQLGEVWNQYLKYKKPGLKPSTYYNYATAYTNYLKSWLDKNIFAIDSDEIRASLAMQSPTMAIKILRALYDAVEIYSRDNLKAANPFWRSWEGLKESKRKNLLTGEVELVKAYSLEEVTVILTKFKAENFGYYSDFLEFISITGCRICEAQELRFKDLARDLSCIHFRRSYQEVSKVVGRLKTNKDRVFPCSIPLKSLLKRRLQEKLAEEQLVFFNSSGDRVLRGSLNKVWAGSNKNGLVPRLVEEKKLSMYLPIYNLRHTFINLAIQKNIPIADVAVLCGNSPDVIANHYLSASKLQRLFDSMADFF